ncbi:MAG: AEC family transporter [Methylococcaceae bacterium]
MTLIMACGAAWRYFSPGGLAAGQTRLVLTSVVYYLLLPAMVLDVLWRAEIGTHSLRYTALGVICVVFALFCLWLLGLVFKLENKRVGAMILAAGFPNVTYLGLPVLQQTFGDWAQSVVIQVDLFAFSPLVFTLGVAIARSYGEDKDENPKSILSFLNAPPFWAAALAVLLNVNQIPAPEMVTGVLQKLAAAVVPLMLFSLGLALSWKALTVRNLPYMLPVVVVKLLLMPLLAVLIVDYLGFQGEDKAASVMEMAMPCMLLGIVFCDRYHLDGALYAMAVTVTTVLSMVSLPFWHKMMTVGG